MGEAGESRGRAHRALARVQGLLGPESVLTAVRRGGRSPADQVRLVPWGDERTDGPGGVGDRVGGDVEVGGDRAPWPGRLPAPAPATVLPEPLPAVVLDAGGGLVWVDARLAVSAAPAWLTVEDAALARITGWAGPWPADERWWAPAEARRVARFQVSLDDGRALLLALSGSRWTVEASYD